LKIYSFILSHLLWHYILYMKKVPSLTPDGQWLRTVAKYSEGVTWRPPETVPAWTLCLLSYWLDVPILSTNAKAPQMKLPLNPPVPSSVPVVPLSIRLVVHADRHPGSSEVAGYTPSLYAATIPLLSLTLQLSAHQEWEWNKLGMVLHPCPYFDKFWPPPVVPEMLCSAHWWWVRGRRSSQGSSLNSKFQQQEVLVYRGVRHRSELNKLDHGRKHYTQNIVDQVSCLSYQWKANEIWVLRAKVADSSGR
jgi:hypothetical protein